MIRLKMPLPPWWQEQLLEHNILTIRWSCCHFILRSQWSPSSCNIFRPFSQFIDLHGVSPHLSKVDPISSAHLQAVFRNHSTQLKWVSQLNKFHLKLQHLSELEMEPMGEELEMEPMGEELEVEAVEWRMKTPPSPLWPTAWTLVVSDTASSSLRIKQQYDEHLVKTLNIKNYIQLTIFSSTMASLFFHLCEDPS